MPSRAKKSAATYSAHVAELRKYAKGFTAADGFDRRNPAEWTAAQKRQITKYAKAVSALTARPNIVYRARNPDNLRRVQREAGQHPEGLPRLKVAFVPYTGKPGEGRPKIKLNAHGVVVGGDFWDRMPLMFDMVGLVTDPVAEVKRVAKHAPGAKSYTVQAGEFEIIGEAHRDLGSVIRAVQKLMAKYDGVQPLPKGSGNRGDNPRHHHYSKWLKGIIAYKFHGRAQPKQLLIEMERAREKQRLKREAARGRARRRNARK